MITHVQVDDLPFLITVMQANNEQQAMDSAAQQLKSLTGRTVWSMIPTHVEYEEGRAVLFVETPRFTDAQGNVFVRTEDNDFVHVSELSGG